MSTADLVLRASPTSPFVRKVRIAAAVLSLSERIEVQVTDAMKDEADFLSQNPLGKIPVLVTADGQSVYDSRVILEYLDHLAGGGRILPADPDARFAALVLQATADGIMEAGVLATYEVRLRPEDQRSPWWIERQKAKIARAVDALEAKAQPLADPLTVGDIALACALGYLDLRFEGTWREDHPKLVAWLDAFAAKVPAFEETRFRG
ncbi:putative GST-like protein YibF [Hartmannibacter diazotrophicus]|uniref:Putative GST-like protein YibF n=1 Tax=Hartmannibacter diazotrophicus TaxID=1482074 RepID=A0A2C9D9R8_9HYPH|nr:glutathione S-transferase N-terminal domain-containing protein [Hartmannibacter diazotrophicus]SON57037.1 putative GST-like protein YibF [Hartmannibacter diazotrophicus]